jgi:hypothetical protein
MAWLSLLRADVVWRKVARAALIAVAFAPLSCTTQSRPRRTLDESELTPSGHGSVAPMQPSAASGDGALPEPRPGRKFREQFGVSSKFQQGESEADLSLLSDLGVTWVRDSVPWGAMEPAPGRFIDFPPAFQRRLAFYKAHDMGVIFMLAYDNDAAYKRTTNNPAAAFDPAAYGRWSLEVAKRLRQSNIRFVLELWNEPHNMVLRPVLGGAWNGAPPSPWVRHYVRMVGNAVEQVKGFDPGIRIIDDDDMWVIHYWFLEAGLPRELDGFAFHPYVEHMPEQAAVDQKTNWVAPYVAVDADGSFKSAVRRLRERGKEKLGKSPEMWITEWGWPVKEGAASEKAFPEQTVAAWLPRAFVLAEAAGVETLCWFSTQDNADGPMGLTDNGGRKREAYFTFKSLSDELGEYTFVGQVAGVEHQTSGTQGYLFHRARRGKLVVWTIEPASNWLLLEGPLRAARAKDHFGQPLTASLGSRGVASLRLGPAPIYLDFELPNAGLALQLSDVP